MLAAMLSPESASTQGKPSTEPKSDPAASAKADTGNPNAGSTANAEKYHAGPNPRTHSVACVAACRSRAHVSGGCVAAHAASTSPPSAQTASAVIRRRRCRAAVRSVESIPSTCSPSRLPVKRPAPVISPRRRPAGAWEKFLFPPPPAPPTFAPSA